MAHCNHRHGSLLHRISNNSHTKWIWVSALSLPDSNSSKLCETPQTFSDLPVCKYLPHDTWWKTRQLSLRMELCWDTSTFATSFPTSSRARLLHPSPPKGQVRPQKGCPPQGSTLTWELGDWLSVLCNVLNLWYLYYIKIQQHYISYIYICVLYCYNMCYTVICVII